MNPSASKSPSGSLPPAAASQRRFAFCGRVSTEDQQDPEPSRNWQLARARALIEPVGAVVVAEFFDIGLSRSIPWKRRPQAARLLEALKRPDRGFDAVGVGEPQKAFYGNQFGLTFPLFVHYGVQLWVPEVGGAIDPGSDAHDLVMALYGGMSKGERNRIKIRVRAAMASQAATEGRFLGGRPPYGYQLADAGPHPNPGKAADGRRLHVLEPDPATGPTVRRIYAEYLAGNGLYAIAEGLTRDGIPSPSAYDRARNPHRCGLAWSKAAVRVILTNPRYTGRQVWNKQRKDEVLIDVDDVALGHQTKMRWNAPDDWIWSDNDVHPGLVGVADFETVQQLLGAGGRRTHDRKPRRTPREYALTGLMHCGVCQRRMQGSWNNGKPHYRCVFPRAVRPGNRIDHPRSLYIREQLVLPPLDSWLATAFDPPISPAPCGPWSNPKISTTGTSRRPSRHNASSRTPTPSSPDTAPPWSPAPTRPDLHLDRQGHHGQGPSPGRSAGPGRPAPADRGQGHHAHHRRRQHPRRPAPRRRPRQGRRLPSTRPATDLPAGAKIADRRGSAIGDHVRNGVSEGGLEPPCPFGH